MSREVITENCNKRKDFLKRHRMSLSPFRVWSFVFLFFSFFFLAFNSVTSLSNNRKKNENQRGRRNPLTLFTFPFSTANPLVHCDGIVLLQYAEALAHSLLETLGPQAKKKENDQMSAQLFCVEGNFAKVEEILKKITGVDSVASLPTKKGRNVFVKFSSDEAAAAALETLKSVPEVVLPGEKKKKEGDATSQPPAKKKSDNAVTDFFLFESYADAKLREQEVQRQQRTSSERHGERQRSGRKGGNTEAAAQEGDEGQRSRGRGAHGRGRGGRGRGPRVPMIQGHIAVLDNVPFNTTNDQIAKLFMDCGLIYDINRLENMAMVYFDSSDAVQRAILVQNGKKIQNNIITVSSGGSVRVPAPVVMQ